MAIQLKRTGDIAQNGVKLLVYGQAGAGKTSLIATLPSPIVLSAEGGLLSIKDANLHFIEIKTIDDLQKEVKKASVSKDPVLYIQGMYPTGKKAYFAVPIGE